MFQAVQKQALSEKVFTQIRDQILLGHLKPGDKLPSERNLCTTFGVNRGAIREAIKRLEQLQIIQVQHGGGTTILDYRSSGSIELLPSLLLLGDKPNPAVLSSILELRMALGKEIVGLCALRCSSDSLKALHEIVASMLSTKDSDEQEKLSMLFWKHLLYGSQNIAYQLAFNTMNRTFAVLRTSFRPLLAQEWENPTQYKLLLQAIQERKPEQAQAELLRLLVSSTQILEYQESP